MAEDTEDAEDQSEPIDFEDVVSALLKVDPTGIIGKDRKNTENEEGPA